MRHIPAKLRPYVILARLDRPIGWWLLLIPGLWAITMAAGGVLAMSWYDAKVLFLFALGAPIMRAAGCIINDLWDRKLDKQVERTAGRPLASGEISVKSAIGFLCLLLLLGLIILLQMPLVTILLGILAIPLIISYPLMKRITWWPQAFLGITFNFGALMGWAAITDIIELPALILYASGIFWTLAYDTIYAHQDKEDDMRIGIKSSALKLGADSQKYVTIFFILSWGLTAIAMILHGVGAIALAAMILPALHIKWQMQNWNIDNPENSLSLFKSNRDYGLLILFAMLLSY